MKKLYRKGTVHPSPPLVSDPLSFLPATILTLTAALTPEDREVLAYLISCSSGNFSGSRKPASTNTKASFSPSSASPNGVSASSSSSSSLKAGSDHQPCFNCYCFSCYMSFWVRWDSSPNRQLIHEIIDAFEDGLLVQKKKEKGRRDRRKNRGSGGSGAGGTGSKELKKSELNLTVEELTEPNPVEAGNVHENAGDGVNDVEVEDEEIEKGSVRRFMSFLGDRIWSVWT